MFLIISFESKKGSIRDSETLTRIETETQIFKTELNRTEPNQIRDRFKKLQIDCISTRQITIVGITLENILENNLLSL